MSGKLHRETLYRGEKAIAALSKAHVAICGLGAIGSNLAVLLARSGVSQLTLIDFDRVEESNIGTQAYSLEDVGTLKAEALSAMFYRECGLTDGLGHFVRRLESANIKKAQLNTTHLVVDCFDNRDSRLLLKVYCQERHLACLHVGLDTEYGEIRWNESYIVPNDRKPDSNDNPCDMPIARSLIHLTVGVAGESIIRFLTQGVKESYSLTLRDLRISRG
jgi:molybdopterin/thiamine biosynthesis adenylyltransferase